MESKLEINEFLKANDADLLHHDELLATSGEHAKQLEASNNALKDAKNKRIALCNKHLLHNASKVLNAVLRSERVEALLEKVSGKKYFIKKRFFNTEEFELDYIKLVSPTPPQVVERHHEFRMEEPIGGRSEPVISYWLIIKIPVKDGKRVWNEATICFARQSHTSSDLETDWSEIGSPFFDDPALLSGLLQLQTPETMLYYLWDQFGKHEKGKAEPEY